MPDPEDLPHYPIIELTALRTVLGSRLGVRRSFRKDACKLISRLTPPLDVSGKEHIPASGSYLITANHYSRPGFSTSWIALSISSVIEDEVTWITVTEWVYPHQRRERVMRPVMRWVRTGIRKGYGFLAMPTMVPGYATPQQRAEGVRKVLHAVKQNPNIILGLTPEGMDVPGGRLGMPPPGAGKFMYSLNRMGLKILPAAIFEQEGRINLSFAAAYDLALPPETTSADIDSLVSHEVMGRIGQLLP